MADQMTPAQLTAQNASIRQTLLQMGVARLQQISAQTYDPATIGGPVTVNPTNVGLIRGFLIQVDATFTAHDAAALTEMGAANVISRINYNDFNNIDRITTTGAHLNVLASAKNNMVFGGCYAPNVPTGFGKNYAVQQAPNNVAGGADATLCEFFYLPLAYAALDLRGAVYAGLTGATSRIDITLNPNPFSAVPSGSAGYDDGAVYQGAAGNYKAGSRVKVTVYQDYIDQIPMVNGQPLLPPIDLSTVYELKNTTVGTPIANQDYGIGYSTNRTYLSTMLGFNNGGQMNPGTDITSFALELANASNIWKFSPKVAAMMARGQFMADMPTGFYFFDHRKAPINTAMYGNTQLVIQASTVNDNAKFSVAYESFAMSQIIAGGASLPSGA